jgi:hypothetical protein
MGNAEANAAHHPIMLLRLARLRQGCAEQAISALLPQ